MEKLGNTSSAMALALQIAVDHNVKVLLVSTACGDNTMNEALWKEKKSALSFLGVNHRNNVEKSGIEEAERMYRSNKLDSNIIKNYTKIVLANRLEVFLGVDKEGDAYENLKREYSEILKMANQYYDYVIVDLDKQMGEDAQKKILENSTIIVATVSQKVKQIEKIQEMIKNKEILDERTSIMLIGKYMDDTKYNAKNITRNVLKSKKMVHTMPYSKNFFESSQEGMLVDMFLMFMQIKDTDPEYGFVKELKRLNDEIEEKILIIEKGY